jgi:acetoin utilization deacetylase AcuC-like enzyme
MSRVGVVHHSLYQEHDPGPFHPESPRRLLALEEILAGPAAGLFTEVEPRPATKEEICRVHRTNHFERMAATAGVPQTMIDPDTQTSPRSFEAALLAAGGLLELVKEAVAGRIESGLALVRPPGHHAEANRSMGFCLFNNVAVAARYALESLGLDRVLIVDWDLHHGNGTQHSFEEEKRVLYFSTHQYPFYPGSGAATETGRGQGLGYTVNVPLGPGNGDAEYVQIFERLLVPVAEKYSPELILVSAGFDIHHQDPLGSQEVTSLGFAALARRLSELAKETGPLVLTLEGGYSVQGQARGVLRIMEELAGRSPLAPDQLRDDPGRTDIAAVAEARRAQSALWPILQL